MSLEEASFLPTTERWGVQQEMNVYGCLESLQPGFRDSHVLCLSQVVHQDLRDIKWVVTVIEGWLKMGFERSSSCKASGCARRLTGSISQPPEPSCETNDVSSILPVGNRLSRGVTGLKSPGLAGLKLNTPSGGQIDPQTHQGVRVLWNLFLFLCTSARPYLSSTQKYLPGCLPKIWYGMSESLGS